jgi:hypothetical protein
MTQDVLTVVKQVTNVKNEINKFIYNYRLEQTVL